MRRAQADKDQRTGILHMAEHAFGIMNRLPVHGERYDRYEPEKYACLSIDDAVIEPLLPALERLALYWHSLDVPGKGLGYGGITLIPPAAMETMMGILEGPALIPLRHLLAEAKAKNRFVIHFGL